MPVPGARRRRGFGAASLRGGPPASAGVRRREGGSYDAAPGCKAPQHVHASRPRPVRRTADADATDPYGNFLIPGNDYGTARNCGVAEVRCCPPRDTSAWAGTSRLSVTDAYERACAVTSELRCARSRQRTDVRTLVRVRTRYNGILLHADLHRLFDKGYVTVTPDNPPQGQRSTQRRLQ